MAGRTDRAAAGLVCWRPGYHISGMRLKLQNPAAGAIAFPIAHPIDESPALTGAGHPAAPLTILFKGGDLQ